MKKRLIFIAGTDTDAGKTYASVQLLRYFRQKKLKTIALKPIASGCSLEEGRLFNDDALQLAREATLSIPYHQINPFAFIEPIAPMIAAKKAGVSLTLERLHSVTASTFSQPFDLCLVEGVGGWRQPLNEKEFLSDYVVAHNMDIILIVGMRLGCINHALLSAQSILHSGGNLIGWIANGLHEKMHCFEENIEALQSCLSVPLLGTILPYADLRLLRETSPDEKACIF